MPPDYMWEDPEALSHWWDAVTEKRTGGMDMDISHSRSDRSGGDEPGEDGDDVAAYGDMDQKSGSAENDYARILRDG